MLKRFVNRHLFNRDNHTAIADTSEEKINENDVCNGPSSLIDKLPVDIKDEAEKSIKNIKNILIENYADNLAEKMIERYLRFVWNLPASAGHHHARPFGLFLHSIETAINNLKVFESKLFFQYTPDGNIDSYQTRKVKPKEQYAYFLSGLLIGIVDACNLFVAADTETQNPKLSTLVGYFNEVKSELALEGSDTDLKFAILLEELQKRNIKCVSPSAIIQAFSGIDQSNPQSSQIAEVEETTGRDVYAQFLSGLFHDIGKAADVTVSHGKKMWNPLLEGLYDFDSRYNCDVHIKHRKDGSYGLHKKIASAYVAKLISPEDYEYIGIINFSDLIDYFTLNPSRNNKFIRTIDSDMKSTADDLRNNGAKDEVVAVVLEEIIRIIKSAKYPVNTFMPGLWITEDYTAVAMKIIDEARVSASNHEKIKRTVDFKILLKGLVDRRHVKAEEWKCIYTMDLEIAARPFQQKVIQFKNTVIWKEQNVPDLCKMKIKFTIAASD